MFDISTVISLFSDGELLFSKLLWPLLRLLFFIAVGLLIGNLIELLNWTRVIAKLATPLVRIGHLRDISGAAFSMAFFSTISANTMLAEGYEKGELSRKELVFSNLFNSMPSFFLHLPTMFFLAVPFLGKAAVVYVSLVLGAAILRTAGTVLAGRALLPPLPEGCVECRLEDSAPRSWREVFARCWKRFARRMPRILYFTVPVYICVFIAMQTGIFALIRKALAAHVTILSFLPPEGISVVLLHLAAEFSAALSAAGALLDSGVISSQEVIICLLVGNILSSPMRAFRHQFPSYSGIFTPKLALYLIGINQLIRATSLCLVGAGYLLYVGTL